MGAKLRTHLFTERHNRWCSRTPQTMLAKEKRRSWWSRRRLTRMAFGLGFVVAAAAAAHIAAVVYVPRTQWYRAAEQFVRSSPEVSAEVGQIHEVRFIRGGAGRWYSTGREDARLSVSVVGSRGKAVVWMTLVKVSDVRKPTAATLSDENGPKLKVKSAMRN